MPRVEALPRRGVDRLADAVAVLMVVAAFAVLLGAGWIAVAVHGEESRRAAAERGERTGVSAVLLADATHDGGSSSATTAVPVTARWTGPDGHPVTGEVIAPYGAAAGERVTAWLDRSGRPVPAPTSGAAVLAATLLVAFAVLVTGGAGLLAAGLGAGRLLDLARGGYWAREWERVEPTWRRGRSTDQS